MRFFPVLASSMLVACGGSAKDTASADTSSSAADGVTLFANHCAACHGSDGTNGSSPDLSVEVPALDDTELERVITNGKGSMPAISVPDADLSTLVAYLRTTFG
jgi:mono/diheme cytochrome c family protein